MIDNIVGSVHKFLGDPRSKVKLITKVKVKMIKNVKCLQLAETYRKMKIRIANFSYKFENL